MRRLQHGIVVGLSCVLLLTGCKDTNSTSNDTIKEGSVEEQVGSDPKNQKPIKYKDLTEYKDKKPSNAVSVALSVPTEIATKADTGEFKVTPFVVATNGDLDSVKPTLFALGGTLRINEMYLTITEKKLVTEKDDSAVKGFNARGGGFYRYKVTLHNKTGKTFKGSWFTLLSHKNKYGNYNAPLTVKGDKGKPVTVHNGDKAYATLYFDKAYEEDRLNSIVFHTSDKAMQARWAVDAEKPSETYDVLETSYYALNGVDVPIALDETETFEKVAYTAPARKEGKRDSTWKAPSQSQKPKPAESVEEETTQQGVQEGSQTLPTENAEQPVAPESSDTTVAEPVDTPSENVQSEQAGADEVEQTQVESSDS